MAAAVSQRVLRAPACLCVFCGLPGAGKSTLTHRVLGTVTEHGWKAAVVSYDKLIPEQAYYTEVEEDGVKLKDMHTNWKSHRQAVLQYIEQFLERPEVVVELPSSPLIHGAAWQLCYLTQLNKRCVQVRHEVRFLQEEDVNVAQVVKRAVESVFDDKKNEILSQFIIIHKTM
ncbi:hypothetical protein XENOCAPTIV_016648 [Xenoophorus captivus]|uniref:Uncharacterized protein n=1 Tax=Xenoophorus captivus TaxID=1517983 RepID=A0ABV0QT79_9TELE